MRGSLHSQIEGLYHCVAKGIGESRHSLKAQKELDTKIHSDNTRATYLGVWHMIAEYARRVHGLTRIEDLTCEIVQEWLELKVDAGRSRATIATYCSAVRKLEMALNNLQQKKGE